MTLRVSVVVLVLVVAGALSPAVRAGIPDPSHCIVPHCIDFCPAGDDTAYVFVRDIAYNPINGCQVDLVFDACANVRLCADCCAGVTLDWANHRVSAVTDARGLASFPLEMGGACPGATARAFACGVALNATGIPVSSYDLDGDLDVDPIDAALVSALIGTTNTIADLDCDGTVTQSDLSRLESRHLGHFCSGVVPARPTSWGSIKVIYR